MLTDLDKTIARLGAYITALEQMLAKTQADLETTKVELRNCRDDRDELLNSEAIRKVKSTFPGKDIEALKEDGKK